MYLSPEIIQVIELASRKSSEQQNEFVSPEYLFYGILVGKNSAQDILSNYNLKEEEYLKAINEYNQGEKITDEFQEASGSILEKYSQDLVALAKENKLDPVIGREEELRRVMQILSRRTKNNPILNWGSWSRKDRYRGRVSPRIAHDEVPEILKNKRIISLDLGALIAGTRFRGEFEERFKKLLKEIQKDNKIITFIDEIHTLVGAGAAEGAIDASNSFKTGSS